MYEKKNEILFLWHEINDKIMDNTQLRFVFDKKGKANNETKKGLLQIEIRLTGTNICKIISTGIHFHKNQFSPKNGFTCKNNDNALAITGKAVRMFKQIEAFVLSDKCKSRLAAEPTHPGFMSVCSILITSPRLMDFKVSVIEIFFTISAIILFYFRNY